MAVAMVEAPERLAPSVRRVEYAWKPNSRIPIQPEVAGAALVEIEQRRDGLRPLEVVREAASETSPLHNVFEWDNGVAAEEYRINQARHLIGSLMRRVIVGNETVVETRSHVLVTRETSGEDGPDDAERIYVNVEAAMERPIWRGEVLGRALKELRQWRNRYESLKELSDIIAAIDKKIDSA